MKKKRSKKYIHEKCEDTKSAHKYERIPHEMEWEIFPIMLEDLSIVDGLDREEHIEEKFPEYGYSSIDSGEIRGEYISRKDHIAIHEKRERDTDEKEIQDWFLIFPKIIIYMTRLPYSFHISEKIQEKNKTSEKAQYTTEDESRECSCKTISEKYCPSSNNEFHQRMRDTTHAYEFELSHSRKSRPYGDRDKWCKYHYARDSNENNGDIEKSRYIWTHTKIQEKEKNTDRGEYLHTR
jgi:hypothetical protein